MLVVEAETYGGPEVLTTREVPDLIPEPGQVVITVSVVPVLYLDTQIRSGHAAAWFPMKTPYIPGVGVAGHVGGVGDGVDPAWLGRAVVADTGGRGAYAEQAVVAVDALRPVPEGLSLEEAAAVQQDGRTALRLFELARIRPGQTVMVTAAAGGLGILRGATGPPGRRPGRRSDPRHAQARRGPRWWRRRRGRLLGAGLVEAGSGQRSEGWRWMSSSTGWGARPVGRRSRPPAREVGSWPTEHPAAGLPQLTQRNRATRSHGVGHRASPVLTG